MSSEVSNVVTKEPAPSKGAPTSPGPELSLRALGEWLRRGDIGQLPAILMLVVIVIVFSFATGGVFLKPINLSNIVLQVASMAVVALGAVLVLLLAEIDLSLAAVANLCGAVMVSLSHFNHWSAVPAMAAGLAVGIVVGIINGVLVAVMRVPSFVVTLAAYIFYSGLLLHIMLPNTTLLLQDPNLRVVMTGYLIAPYDLLSPLPIIIVYAAALLLVRARRVRAGLTVGPQWTMWVPVAVVAILSYAALLFIFEASGALGVPYSLYVVVGLLIVFWLLLRFTTYGRHVYAVGGNPEAARRAGINVVVIRISVFALASMLAGFAGMLDAARESIANSSVDPALLLLAIAVAVIGGVSLFGGRGSVWGVLIGVLIIGCLQNGLTLFTATGTDLKYMFEGLVLIIAVLLDALTRRRNAVSGR